MSSRLKWDKHNKLEVARDFSQGRRKYLYSEIDEPTETWTDLLDGRQYTTPKKETDMDVECGMCGDVVKVTTDLMAHLNEGVICVPCQEHTMGYLFPEMPEVVEA